MLHYTVQFKYNFQTVWTLKLVSGCFLFQESGVTASFKDQDQVFAKQRHQSFPRFRKWIFKEQLQYNNDDKNVSQTKMQYAIQILSLPFTLLVLLLFQMVSCNEI